jgi:hypothetical protein
MGNELLGLLKTSGRAWDHSAFKPMLAAFHSATPEEREEFRLAAAALPYAEYKRTIYWGVVRGWIYHERGHKCENAPAHRMTLNVHHKTYEHRGAEYDHLGDLSLLCRSCHEGHHGLSGLLSVAQHVGLAKKEGPR